MPLYFVTRAALAFLLLLAFHSRAAHGHDTFGEEQFEKRVRPILANACFRCHGGLKVSGSLRLDSREALLRGGESGAAIDLKNPEKSLLLAAVRRDDAVSAMPPDAALSAQQVADLTAWIKAGAPWPVGVAKFEVAPHWAFEPRTSPPLPPVKNAAWPLASIDYFVLAKLEEEKLMPAPPASRRALLKRITYDLTGLPPTAAEYAAFENDNAPQAYESVVERLLASPAYGERYGRHWLDIVRYADTAGENSDHPLPHAWRYRNWVIDAFNRDLPYDDFVRQQIAGDLPTNRDSAANAERMIATGYLAIARRFGHEIDKEMHLTLEDTLDNVGKAFLGLSIGCARCHDHKFDPISVQDYYGLYGIFESTKFSFPGCEPQQQPRDLVALPLSPALAAQDQLITAQAKQLEVRQQRAANLEQQFARQFQEGAAKAALLAASELDEGKQTTFAEAKRGDIDKLTLKRGDVLLLTVAPRGNHGADSTRVEWEIHEVDQPARSWNVNQLLDELPQGNPHRDAHGHEKVWYFLDRESGGRLLPESLSEISGRRELLAWRNGDTPSVFVNKSDQPIQVWTELQARSFFVHPGPRGAVSVAWVSPIAGVFSLKGSIADAHPGGPDGVAWQLEHVSSREVTQALEQLDDNRAERAKIASELGELQSQRPQSSFAYAVQEGTARNARIHKRGEPTNLGDEAPRKFLDVLGGQRLQTPEASGRTELAEWLVDERNPLTARVVANRVWQWHFGRGLVATPNDFGTRGAAPSHPELLDHLASELVRSNWSLKSLHRQIVRSATYRQAAVEGAAAASYAGFARRRLSAEEIRDTLLAAGGTLEHARGAAHPFPPENTWNFTQHAPFAADYDTNLRSVYVMQKRNRRGRFFALFDGADPNASSPLRDLTTVPTQALYFLNDPLVHAQSEKFAARVLAAANTHDARLNFASWELFGHPATETEQRDLTAFLESYSEALHDTPAGEREQLAWQAYARVLLSSSEVLHVD